MRSADAEGLNSMVRKGFVCVALAMLAPALGNASFITWEINEVFTNADGTIQFIEFFEADGRDGQRSFDGKLLKTFELGAGPNAPLAFHLFDADLPSNQTANRFALVATEGFASLPGAVQPDFVMPDGFIDPETVAEIELGTIDEFLFLPGDIPTDGVNSLARVGPLWAPNTPTNFAGQQGSIDLPEPAAAAQGAAALVCLLALRGRSVKRSYASRSVRRQAR